MLKTLKEEEKHLLLETGILENYYQYLMSEKTSLLSKYLGVYTIRVAHMADITCFIMDNLLGKDFANIERIYDLKGSTKGRKAQISNPELPTGLKVLKDMNFLELKEKLEIDSKAKR